MTMFIGITGDAWRKSQKNSQWKFFVQNTVKISLLKYNNKNRQRAVADRGKAGIFGKGQQEDAAAVSIQANSLDVAARKTSACPGR
jgi:hypothetical protein